MKFLGYLLFIFIMAGCCKVYCDGTELGVSFQKFKALDTDTVLFVNYEPGTQQTKVIDSFFIRYAVPSTDTSHSSVSHTISSAYDWKIQIPSVNKQYILTGFSLTNRHCNCGGKYKAIESFLVNDIRKEGLFLELE